MKVVAFRQFGPPDVLQPEDWKDPSPGANEVVLRVKAVSVGRFLDLATRAGRNPYFAHPLPHVLGAEHSGEVVEVGRRVTALEPGDRVAVFPSITCGRCSLCKSSLDYACTNAEVIGIHRQGAYAEFSCVPVANCTLLPEPMSDRDASAMALCGPLAWMLLNAAQVENGSWVLVHAVSSGLNSLIATLARDRGANVIGTSRNPAKYPALRNLGLAALLDSYSSDFPARVEEVTSGRGVQVLVNNVGSAGDWPNLMTAMAPAGVIVCAGAFLGQSLELDLRSFYQKSLKLLSFRRASKRAVKAFWDRAFVAPAAPLLDREFPLADAGAAHKYVEQGDQIGRVTLVP